jgi:uncharacterized protein (DUF488 family)
MHDAFTIGRGVRPLEELVPTLREAGVEILVDARRFPGSRGNPQINQGRPQKAGSDPGGTAV